MRGHVQFCIDKLPSEKVNKTKKVLLGSFRGKLMFHITRKGDYAIRGMVYLASRPGGTVSLLREVAASVDVPQALLAKIFQDLCRLGFVKSYRGAGGGFELARPASKISLLEVIEAVDGPIGMNRCIVEKGVCGRESFCGVHPVWKQLQQKVRSELGRVSLLKLAKDTGRNSR